MRKLLLCSLLAGGMLLGETTLPFNPTAAAHPGRTDADGCHTCRTNCASWGLPTGDYHCHEPDPPSVQPPTTAPPSPTPLPTDEQKGEIRRLYLAYFEREPDAGGTNYWSELYARGRTLSAISLQFAQSNEFTERYGDVSDSGFVTLVYNNVLDRNPDHAGLAYWTSMMAAGRTRGWVMIGFSNSAEFKAKTSSLPT
ncbi:MAG: DUF4214 domain-containing protein [Acidimicrobiia bacterium]